MTPIALARRCAPLLLVAALAGSPAPSPAADPAPPRLFGPTLEGRAALKQSDVATVRARAVRPDLAAIDALAREHVASAARRRLVLDLFPGLELDAEVIGAEVRASGTTLFARLEGIELGTAMLTHEAGVLVGTIDFPGGSYAVEALDGGAYRIAQKAVQLAPPELPPRVRFAPARAEGFDAEPDVPADSGRLIDVMIVWTPAAQAAAGSASAMQSLAQASIDNANLTYLNSGVAQRLRLVHAQQVTYTERTNCAGGGTRFDCALDDITDGLIPNVHALRDTHGADLVSIFIQDNAYCGLAWLPYVSAGTANLGYSVLSWDYCPVGNKSFVHELGHNMGAHHDTYVLGGFGGCPDGKEDGAFCYSRGYVNLAARWRTVLAYNNQCADTPPNTGCTRVQYLSNPRLTYGGAPMGDATARNNAHTLNKTAKAIAGYRPTSPLHPLPQRFTDVAAAHPFHGYIEFFAQAGVSSGCTAGQYCPNDPVTRRQMAVFIERALRASNWVPPPATGVFTDMPPGSQFRDHAEALRNDGITSGCTATTYCPDDVVTRAQMATFLLRARCGSAYVPNQPAVPSFADVPALHPMYRFIEKLYALGVTGGCAIGPLRYCPESPVTRGQMAVFVERMFPFLTPTEVCAL